jgi:hypothetical protein
MLVILLTSARSCPGATMLTTKLATLHVPLVAAREKREIKKINSQETEIVCVMRIIIIFLKIKWRSYDTNPNLG